MKKYFTRNLCDSDYKQVVDIYNSNRQFLLKHLGVEQIDEAFIREEASTMSEVGFKSCVIVDIDSQLVQGVIDYKQDKEVYLSLFMLSADLQGKGIGTDIYSCFEQEMKRGKSDSIRIDVVNDYNGNVVPFWEKNGYIKHDNITIEWGKKKSNAVVMRKTL